MQLPKAGLAELAKVTEAYGSDVKNTGQGSNMLPTMPRANGPSLRQHPVIEKAKVSQRPLVPNMMAYGANTHNGLIRNYNEDRISIVLDLKKPGIQPNSNK